MDLTILFKLLASLVLGAFIGLEREYHKEEVPRKTHKYSSLGVRTFSFLTLMGSLSGVFYSSFMPVSLIVTAATMLLILANYVMGSMQTRDTGITTEIASIFSYAIGFIIAMDVIPIQITIALTVIATLILSRKEAVKSAVARLHGFETNAFINYAVIALVILPFLPNRAIYLSDIQALTTLLGAYNISLGPLANVELVNPYKLWFLVALITGIDLLGYFLNKYIGKTRGYLLSAISGGFVSSTATTIALAQESKRTTIADKLVGAAIFANTASFFQMLFLLAPTSGVLLVASTMPILAMIAAGIISGLFFLKSASSVKKITLRKKQDSNVFSLASALKFAGIYVLIRIISGIALVYLGNSGVYLTSMLGALAGLDAVILNLADLTIREVIPVRNALFALLIANAVNLIAKIVYSYVQGSRGFTIRLTAGMITIIAASVLAAFI